MVSTTSKSQKKDGEDFGVEALKSEISIRIRKVIREAGGNAVVSKKSGIPLRTVSNYTRGLSEPKLISLSRIAKVCEVSLDWLATGEGPKHLADSPSLALDMEALETAFKISEDMHWSDVKAALEKQGLCLAEVALSLGVSGAAVTKVKRVPNHDTQTAIAKALDTMPGDIWPTRYYHSNGKPMRPSIWMRKNSRRATKGPIKNVKAA